MTTDLITFVREFNGNNAADIPVSQMSTNGVWQHVRAAGGWYEDDLGRIQVGPSKGEDNERGAYDWWELTLDGETVGDLIDGGNGLAINAAGI